MDNKIIIGLIKKDIEELLLLVEAIDESNNQSNVLVDICQSKIQSLMHEISLLKRVDNVDKETKNPEIVPETHSESVIETEKVERESDSFNSETLDSEDKKQSKEEYHADDEFVMPDNAPVANEKPVSDIEKAEQPAIENSQASNVVAKDRQSNTDDKSDIVVNNHSQSEAEKSEAKVLDNVDKALADKVKSKKQNENNKVLGESFSHEPSLNEKFASLAQKQSRIKAKPIQNLKKAIGINDRFLFTRELFENNMSRFETTIDEIDNSGNLVEAISYLEENFEWEKNETSLKFIDLVKRRFDN